MYLGVSIFSFLIMLSIMLLFISCNFFFSFFVTFFPCSNMLSSFEFIFSIDNIVCACLTMLLVCSILAFVYCFHYFSYNISEGLSLFYLILLFVFVMFNLFMTSSLIFTLILWEYLGFVSFLLILFYSNSMSIRASLITLFSSRFGDVALFMVLVWLGLCGELTFLFFFFFFLVVVTKSAGFPFISWLLEAMRAPTPVSSLVHSSTLVAAGVWFLLRYGFVVDSCLLFYLFVISLLTVFVTGVSALFFLDLKKVVALSTCNNISWCLLFFTCGDLDLVLFQLVVHGLCKCVLFMLVGDIMSSSGGSQNALNVFLARYSGVYSCILLVVLVLGLCGIPFLGVFFSKHYFFSVLVALCYNPFVVFLVLLAFFVSYSYSFRLCLLVCSGFCGMCFGYVVVFLFVGCFVFFGTLVCWYVLGCLGECCELSYMWSVFFLVLQLLGCLVGYVVYSVFLDGFFWFSLVGNNDYLVGWWYKLYELISGFSFFLLYRWEVGFMSLINCLVDSGVYKVCFFSLNVFVLGLVYYIVFGYFLCYYLIQYLSWVTFCVILK